MKPQKMPTEYQTISYRHTYLEKSGISLTCWGKRRAPAPTEMRTSIRCDPESSCCRRQHRC